MIKIQFRKNRFFCICLVILLIAPTIQGVFKITREGSLYGYIDPIPEKPTHYLPSFFDKSLQQWIEKKFNAHVGFRALFIRSFNEINFKLFRETDTSRLKLMTSKRHGLYSNLSIDSLNRDVMLKHDLDQYYQMEAQKLRTIQDKLAAQGKQFQVVIASSKAYVYPKELGSRLLAGGSAHIFNRAISFGAILKAAGVNVIDSGPLLRQRVHTAHIETHPASGLHWNYYAACLVAQAIIDKAQQVYPTMAGLGCDPAQRIYSPMNDVDVDGYLLLNLWSDVGLLARTTYPTIHATPPIQQMNTAQPWQPRIVFIGDSFSDQIRFAFKKANMYSHIVMSSYFKTREVQDQNGILEASNDTAVIQAQLLADMKSSDLVILELVDYNIHPSSDMYAYGFADYVAPRL